MWYSDQSKDFLEQYKEIANLTLAKLTCLQTNEFHHYIIYSLSL